MKMLIGLGILFIAAGVPETPLGFKLTLAMTLGVIGVYLACRGYSELIRPLDNAMD